MKNKEQRDYINNQIKTYYSTEDSVQLSRRLGITLEYLRVRAKRLNCKKGTRTVTNEIINGEKLCPNCGKILPIQDFNRDKYQPNNYDYWCRSCRHNAILKKNETAKNNKISDSTRGVNNMAFGVKKTRNPIVRILDDRGILVLGLKCKACLKEKPLSDFYKLHRDDSDDTFKRKNICIQCMKEKREKNKCNK